MTEKEVPGFVDQLIEVPKGIPVEDAIEQGLIPDPETLEAIRALEEAGFTGTRFIPGEGEQSDEIIVGLEPEPGRQ